jgi:hypothetical protein
MIEAAGIYRVGSLNLERAGEEIDQKVRFLAGCCPAQGAFLQTVEKAMGLPFDSLLGA